MRWIPSTFCTKDKFKNKGTSQTFLFRISVKKKKQNDEVLGKKSTSHNRWHWLKVNDERIPLFFCKMGNYNGMEVPNGGSWKLWLIDIDDSFTFESCKLHRCKDSWIKNALTGYTYHCLNSSLSKLWSEVEWFKVSEALASPLKANS